MEKSSYHESEATGVQAQGLVLKRANVSFRLVIYTLWAGFAAFTFGFNNAIIASSLGQPNLAIYFNLGARSNVSNIIGCIAGFPNVGGLIGVPLIAWSADKFGRRKAMLLCCVFMALGAALAAGSRNLAMLIAGRFWTGFGGWAMMLVGVLYAAEIAPATQRGLLGGMIGFGLSTGYIAASWTGYGFFFYADPINWRVPFILQLVPLAVVFLGCFIVPESPRWLVKVGRAAESLEVLKQIHASKTDPNHVLPREEHYQIVKQEEIDRTLPSSWLSMFTKYRKRSLCAAIVMVGQEATGVPIIVSFGPLLYASLGFSAANSLAIAGGWITMGFVIEPISAWLSDRVGRRVILYTSTFMCGVVVFSIFTALQAQYTGTTNLAGQRGAIAMIFVFGLFFFPQEPVGFLYISEIFPSHIRAKGIAVGLGAINICYVWITFTQPVGQANVGWKYNLVFILLSLCMAVLQFFILPETKNVAIEEMARLFGDDDEVAVRAENIYFDAKTNEIVAASGRI